jgi:ABC-type transport system substrate-binding protein
VMQQRIHDEVPAIFLVYRTEFEAINPSLRGFAPNMLYNFSQTEAWSLR